MRMIVSLSHVNKVKTTSVNEYINDHNITGITQVSIRDRFRPRSRDSSGGRKTAWGTNEKTKPKQCDVSATLDGFMNYESHIIRESVAAIAQWQSVELEIERLLTPNASLCPWKRHFNVYLSLGPRNICAEVAKLD